MQLEAELPAMGLPQSWAPQEVQPVRTKSQVDLWAPVSEDAPDVDTRVNVFF